MSHKVFMILNIKLQDKYIANQTRKDNADISLNIKISHSEIKNSYEK